MFPHPRTCSKCDFKLYEKDFYETTILFKQKTYILFFPFTRMIHFFLEMKLWKNFSIPAAFFFYLSLMIFYCLRMLVLPFKFIIIINFKSWSKLWFCVYFIWIIIWHSFINGEGLVWEWRQKRSRAHPPLPKRDTPNKGLFILC